MFKLNTKKRKENDRKRQRVNEPAEPPDDNHLENERTEAMLKIARNCLKQMGLGVEDKKAKFLKLSKSVKDSIKTTQVNLLIISLKKNV